MKKLKSQPSISYTSHEFYTAEHFETPKRLRRKLVSMAIFFLLLVIPDAPIPFASAHSPYTPSWGRFPDNRLKTF